MGLVRTYNRLIFTVGVLLVGLVSQAQVVYPVQASASITPPYSLSLEDYASADYDRFRVNLLLSDLQASNYEVKLRLTIEGPDGKVFQSNKAFWQNADSYILDGGVPQTFTGFDLKDYFNVDNLNFPSSYSRATYNDSKVLPEGLYIFKIELFDAASVVNFPDNPIEVSNAFSGLAVAVLTRNDPPFLNTPFDNDLIEGTSVDFGLHSIPMSWTPRHVSINSSFNTIYKLKIVEVNPPTRNPYDAINTSTPIFETELTTTSYNFNFVDAALVIEQLPATIDTVDHTLYKGRKYAWQIQALDESKKDVFKNGGFSEVYTFFYADPCEHPEIFSYEAGDAQNVLLEWDASSNTEFEIYYKPMGSSSADKIVSTTQDNIEITDLEPSTTYEFSIKAACTDVWTSKKKIGNVTTSGNVVEVCAVPSQINVSKVDLTYDLSWEEISGAASYEVQVKKVGETAFTSEAVAETSHKITFVETELPAIIRVDAVCKDGVGNELGEEIEITVNTDGFVGECSVPVPLNIDPISTDDQINLGWSSNDEHISHDFRFRTKGSTEAWIETTTSEPLWEDVDANFNILYEYQINFHCSVDEESGYSAIEYFVVEKDKEEEEVDPGTGDCFEPPVVQHEVRENEKVKLVWDQVSEAAAFEIYYKVSHLANWQMVRTTSTTYMLTDLLIESEYVYKIRSECEQGFSVYTPEQKFNTSQLSSTEDCPEITAILDSSKGKTSMYMYCEIITDDHEQVVLFYKKSSQSIADWYQVVVDTPRLDKAILVQPLDMRTSYDFKAQATCGVGKSHMSEVYTDTTAGEAIYPEDFVCGAMANECPGIQETASKPNLIKGDKFMAHDFEVEVVDVTKNADGTFTGEGQILIGFPNDSYVAVDFEDIIVNTSGCLRDGQLVMTSTTIHMLDEETRDKVNEINDQVNNYLTILANGPDETALFVLVEEILSDHSNLDPELIEHVGNIGIYLNQIDSLLIVAKAKKAAGDDRSTTLGLLTDAANNFLTDLGVYSLLEQIQASLDQLFIDVSEGVNKMVTAGQEAVKTLKEVFDAMKGLFEGTDDLGGGLVAIGDSDGDGLELSDTKTHLHPEPVDSSRVPKGKLLKLKGQLTDALRSYGFKENMTEQDYLRLYNKIVKDIARAEVLFSYAKTLLEGDNIKKLVFEIQKDLTTVVSSALGDLKSNVGGIVSGISLQNLQSKVQDIKALLESFGSMPLVQDIKEGDKEAFKKKLFAYLESKIIAMQQATQTN